MPLQPVENSRCTKLAAQMADFVSPQEELSE